MISIIGVLAKKPTSFGLGVGSTHQEFRAGPWRPTTLRHNYRLHNCCTIQFAVVNEQPDVYGSRAGIVVHHLNPRSLAEPSSGAATRFAQPGRARRAGRHHRPLAATPVGRP